MPLCEFRFPSLESYHLVSAKGRRVKVDLLTLKIYPATDNHIRFCFVVKKKNGNAVFRNRCRRVLRPLFFESAANFPAAVWVMAVVEMKQAEANWETLRECGKEAVKCLSN